MRRGELVWSELLTMIIIAASALILLVWFYMAQQELLGEKDIEVCRLSVQAYARSWVDTIGGDVHLFDVDCKRRVVTFLDGEVEMNGKELSFFDPDVGKRRSAYSELTPGIVNSVAAAEMATCWYEFLEGKSYWTNEIDINNDDRACFVCSEIHFDGQFNYQATKLFDFLETNMSRPFPRMVDLKKGTNVPDYYTYLYLEDHVCDETQEKLPTFLGLASTQYQAGQESYWKHFYYLYKQQFPGDTCEEAFLAYIIVEKEWLDNAIRLTPDRSYKVLFFQHGKDKDALGSKGTSYAPLILPASELTSDLCTTFIG